MKREDMHALDAALGADENAAPIGENGEASDGEQPDDSLRSRLRRGGCATSCGPYGCTTTCTRMKRENMDAQDAVLDVSEDDDSLRSRLRRGCATSCGPYGCTTTCTRLRREDFVVLEAAIDAYENEESENHRVRRSTDSDSRAEEVRLRLRRCAAAAACGPTGCVVRTDCRLKREDLDFLDAVVGAYENANDDATPIRARRSSTCQWQCVCTASGVPSYGIDSNGRPYSFPGGSGTTVTRGRCTSSSSSDGATCQSVQQCD
jgi:hypothetical protein